MAVATAGVHARPSVAAAPGLAAQAPRRLPACLTDAHAPPQSQRSGRRGARAPAAAVAAGGPAGAAAPGDGAARSSRQAATTAVTNSSGLGGISNGIASGSAAQRGTHAQADADLGVPPAELMPSHVALIMDGNSRWAASRNRPAAFGYQRGIEALRTVVRCLHRYRVPCLTVYAFSAENWSRPAAEVDTLLALMERTLEAEVAELARNGVRLRFIGELGMLPRSLQNQMRSAELATGDNSDLHLTVAVSYSGRQDLTLAAQEIARRAAAGELRAADVSAALLESLLATRQLPAAWRHPDLLIRTSGERRLSNFLTWEVAYTELHFSDCMWPEFGEAELAAALRDYAARERRFGGRRARGASRGEL